MKFFLPRLLHSNSFCRVGGSYDRRFIDERFSRDDVYPRNTFHQEVYEREDYPPPSSVVDPWPQARRRGYEEEYPLDRESRRHEKPYLDSYHDVDTYRDHGFDRPTRFGGRNRDDYAYDDYDNRSSHERDHDYGRHSYDSDYDRGTSKRDGNWRRRDKRSYSRERDLSPPHRKNELSRSRDRVRSRSPRGRSHGRSHREDSYDDVRYERIEKRRDREERRQYDHYSMVGFLVMFCIC